MQKFRLEFILHIQNGSVQTIKNSLAEFGEDLEVSDFQEAAGQNNNFKVKIKAEDPTVIFDICSQFGRIKSIKVSEATT